MRPAILLQRLSLAASWTAGLVLAVTVGYLTQDWIGALRRRPADRERLAALELAVREDASHSPELDAEYDRQRDETLARRELHDVAGIAIAVSAVLCVLAGKSYAKLRGDPSPSIAEIETHRAFGKRHSRKRRAKRAAEPVLEVDDPGFVDRVIDEEGTSLEATIPILQRIQRHYRYLPQAALLRVCERTEITPHDIAGVSTFYARFRHFPVGRRVVRVCQGTACHVAGSGRIRDEMRRALRVPDGGDTDPDRQVTIDEVACVGCCSLAPVISIEDEIVGRLTPATAMGALSVHGIDPPKSTEVAGAGGERSRAEA